MFRSNKSVYYKFVSERDWKKLDIDSQSWGDIKQQLKTKIKILGSEDLSNLDKKQKNLISDLGASVADIFGKEYEVIEDDDFFVKNESHLLLRRKPIPVLNDCDKYETKKQKLNHQRPFHSFKQQQTINPRYSPKITYDFPFSDIWPATTTCFVFKDWDKKTEEEKLFDVVNVNYDDLFSSYKGGYYEKPTSYNMTYSPMSSLSPQMGPDVLKRLKNLKPVKRIM